MSVENFYQMVPPTQEGIQAIKIRKEEFPHLYRDNSLVVVLARQLSIHGIEGVREILKEINPSDTMSVLDQKNFNKLPEQYQQKMIVNYASIVFGHVVLSLERTAVNRKYDHKDFLDRLNTDIRDLQFSEHKPEEGRLEEELSKDQLEQMYSVLRGTKDIEGNIVKAGDKTFTSFFKEGGLQAMPRMLRQFLQQNGVIPIIQEHILPEFYDRAKLLIATNK